MKRRTLEMGLIVIMLFGVSAFLVDQPYKNMLRP